MNAEIGAEAAQFPEKEYKNGIAVAVLIIWKWLHCQKIIDYLYVETQWVTYASDKKQIEEDQDGIFL